MAQSSTFKFFNSEKDVIIALYKSPEALLIYKDLPRNVKQDFLDVCMGKRGIPLHYDVFSKRCLALTNILRDLDDSSVKYWVSLLKLYQAFLMKEQRFVTRDHSYSWIS